MTAADLRNASALPRRTIYQALRVLREGGLVHHRRSLQDTRQTYFWLADAAAAAAGPTPSIGLEEPGTAAQRPPSSSTA